MANHSTGTEKKVSEETNLLLQRRGELPAAISNNGGRAFLRNNKTWVFASIIFLAAAMLLALTVPSSPRDKVGSFLLGSPHHQGEGEKNQKRLHHHSMKSSTTKNEAKKQKNPAMTKAEALKATASTGIDIVRTNDNAITWSGPFGGQNKPTGPLHGKKIGLLVASEFSDFQAYYLVSYIGELGGSCEFLLVDWVTWKNVRPNTGPNKGVRGMWDISVDPIPVMGGDKATRFQSLQTAMAQDYDALIILGGHSADVMVTEVQVIDFLQQAAGHGVVLGSIGAGSLPLIAAGVMNGKKCTGNAIVNYMLAKIANLQETKAVVADGNVITARDTVDTPAFVRALGAHFDPSYNQGVWKNSMAEKRVLLPIGEDYEDIEVVVAVMESLYRGAEVIIGRFTPQFTSRPAHGPLYALGSFGTTVPFQEIDDSYYKIMDLHDIRSSDYDVAVITGGFNPWNMVATGKVKWFQKAHSEGKLIAAVCHGPVLLAAADLVKDKKLTGWLASKTPVEIMGGQFNSSDWAAVIDGQIITGRTAPEMPEFMDAITVALLD